MQHHAYQQARPATTVNPLRFRAMITGLTAGPELVLMMIEESSLGRSAVYAAADAIAEAQALPMMNSREGTALGKAMDKIWAKYPESGHALDGITGDADLQEMQRLEDEWLKLLNGYKAGLLQSYGQVGLATILLNHKAMYDSLVKEGDKELGW